MLKISRGGTKLKFRNKFRPNAPIIEATQWFKSGDHPQDGDEGEDKVVRYYRHPDNYGARACDRCGHTMHQHGWIDSPGDGHIVCPRDWITKDGNGYYPCKPAAMKRRYEQV